MKSDTTLSDLILSKHINSSYTQFGNWNQSLIESEEDTL